MKKPTAKEIIETLNLEPLHDEGGLFFRTYVSDETILKENLPSRYSESKPFGTAIFYLLTHHPDSFSALHTLPTDEIYHFYLGDPIELFEFYPDGSKRKIIMGQDLLNGQVVQHIVPHQSWHGSRLVAGGEWALLGTTMAPGYTNGDFKIETAENLSRQFPKHIDLVQSLTR